MAWYLVKHRNLAPLRSVRRLLVTANVVISSLILVTLMMEAISSSDTSVFTRATRCNVPEDDILRVISSPTAPFLLSEGEGHSANS
jgi:hypothetical protein